MDYSPRTHTLNAAASNRASGLRLSITRRQSSPMRVGREVVRWPLSIHVSDAMKLFVGLNLIDLQAQQRRLLLSPA